MGRPLFQRRGGIDQQLEDLIKAGSWKQAIALSEKRIKKGDKSDGALVTKAHVLLACPDTIRQQLGRRELESLIGREPPITDVDVLVTIHRFAHCRKDSKNLLKPLWARAAKARPQDEELLKAWFETAFHFGSYEIAQEASIAYKNQFPQHHHAHFWHIITCMMIAESSDFDETLRLVNQRLALALLAKAAKGAASGEMPANGLRLESLEDLLLVLRFYQVHGKYQEALKILDDDRTGIFSELGNKNWQLVRQRIELLEQTGQWQEMWHFCAKLLDDSYPEVRRMDAKVPTFPFGRAGDDWSVWTGLIAATIRIGTKETFSDAERYTNAFPKTSRNARIARLKLYASWRIEGDDIQTRLLAACQEHFIDFSSRDVCFQDLFPYLQGLRPEHQVELLEAVSRHARSLKPGPNNPETQAIKWATSEINVLKLLYYLRISKEPTKSDRDQLGSFVCRCLRLFQISHLLCPERPISERRPADDAAILASMALVHISELGESTALLRSAVLLESLLEGSRHNYDALLIQIRLCLKLGISSMAMERYLQLSVKNMQHATTSWLLYSQISVLHPYSYMRQHSNTTASHFMDLPKGITDALDWHVTAEETLAESLSNMLKEGQYNMLFDSLWLYYSVKMGFSKLLLVSEWSRIQRLTGASGQKDYLESLTDIRSGTEFEDKRDTKAFPNYEWGTDCSFASLLENDYPIDKLWLHRQQQILFLCDLLDESPRISREFLRTAQALSIGLAPEPEQTHLKVLTMAAAIWELYYSGRQPHSAGGPVLESLETLEDLQKMATDVLASVAENPVEYCLVLRSRLCLPQAAYFKMIFGTFDVCNTIKKTMDSTVRWNKQERLVDPVELQKISVRITDSNQVIASKVEKQARAMQKALQGEHNIAFIVAAVYYAEQDDQDSIGLVFNKVIGQSRMEEIAEDLRGSWMEALEGIVKAAKHLGGE